MELFKKDPYAIVLSCGTILFGLRLGVRIGHSMPLVRVPLLFISLNLLKGRHIQAQQTKCRFSTPIAVFLEFSEEIMFGYVIGLLLFT